MSEIIEALDRLEKEKNIEKEYMFDAIERSLKQACTKEFDLPEEGVEVTMDREDGSFHMFSKKTVVEEVENVNAELSLEQAKIIDAKYELGDIVTKEITIDDFSRIAAQGARNVIVQAIRESERDSVFNSFVTKEKDIITGVVQRYVGKNVIVSLDERTETMLKESEMVPGEVLARGDRVKLYITEVKKPDKGKNKNVRINVSRSHPDMVKCLFEKEVTEIADGTVEIMSSCREAGSRSKIAVWSNDPDVDPVGACVGMNGARVNNVVEDLNGEKIDIICWDENPAIFIKNALSPSEVIAVDVDLDENSAFVVVPDYQLSLAIGKKGQNARLAARLTGYKIDIKSESQAEEMGYFDESDDYDEEYYDEEYDGEYEEGEYADEEYADEEYIEEAPVEEEE